MVRTESKCISSAKMDSFHNRILHVNLSQRSFEEEPVNDEIYTRLLGGKGVMAKSNAEHVEKIVRIARELSLEPATPDEAREILDLKGLDKVNF